MRKSVFVIPKTTKSLENWGWIESSGYCQPKSSGFYSLPRGADQMETIFVSLRDLTSPYASGNGLFTTQDRPPGQESRPGREGDPLSTKRPEEFPGTVAWRADNARPPGSPRARLEAPFEPRFLEAGQRVCGGERT